MAKKTSWTKIRHAYICGEESYRELARKFEVPLKTLSGVAKRENWVTKRRQFRDDVNTRAYARAREAEVDELESIRQAADKLGGKLEEIMADERQLFFHTAVVRHEDGSEDMTAKELEAVNPDTLRALAKAMKDLTAVLRDLHGLSTRAEERAEKLARDKLALEKKKFELEKERAGAAEGDRTITVEIAPEAEEMAQ